MNLNNLCRVLFMGPLLMPLVSIAAPASPTIWTLDRLDRIGGRTPRVLGAPVLENNAIRFDGARDGLILPVNPIAGSTAFTVEVLIRPETGGLEEQRFLHIQDEAEARLLLELRINPDGRWAVDSFLRDGEHQLPLLDRTKSHAPGEWRWVALRYDGRNLAHFVDGVLEMEGAVAFRPMRSRGECSLGVRLNQVYWFKGAIREVRFHPVALRAEHLQARPK
jgi:hypothetical protein